MHLYTPFGIDLTYCRNGIKKVTTDILSVSCDIVLSMCLCTDNTHDPNTAYKCLSYIIKKCGTCVNENIRRYIPTIGKTGSSKSSESQGKEEQHTHNTFTLAGQTIPCELVEVYDCNTISVQMNMQTKGYIEARRYTVKLPGSHTDKTRHIVLFVYDPDSSTDSSLDDSTDNGTNGSSEDESNIICYKDMLEEFLQRNNPHKTILLKCGDFDDQGHLLAEVECPAGSVSAYMASVDII